MSADGRPKLVDVGIAAIAGDQTSSTSIRATSGRAEPGTRRTVAWAVVAVAALIAVVIVMWLLLR